MTVPNSQAYDLRDQLHKNPPLKQIRVNEDGTLMGLSSVKIKVSIPGIKKPKAYSFNAAEAADKFTITVTNVSKKTSQITAKSITSGFTGTRGGITVKKK